MGTVPARILVVVVACLVGEGAGWGDAETLDRVARARLEAAEAAIEVGDLATASASLEAAWITTASPIWETAWRRLQGARLGLLARCQRVASKLEAARRIPAVRARLDEARAALAAASAPKRPRAAAFDRAIGASAACERDVSAAVQAGADSQFQPGGADGLAALQAACRRLTDEALARKADAEAAAVARDQAIRSLLGGDRRTIYEQYGEPVGDFTDDSPAGIARARTWIYVLGPTGALETYERWIFVFQGNRLVSRRRITSHEQP